MFRKIVTTALLIVLSVVVFSSAALAADSESGEAADLAPQNEQEEQAEGDPVQNSGEEEKDSEESISMYRITFQYIGSVPKGAAAPESVGIKEGQVYEPADPVKVYGYTFLGWFLDERASQAFVREEITEDTVIYGKWKKTAFRDMVPVIRVKGHGEANCVSWKTVDGASGYDIYRGKKSGGKVKYQKIQTVKGKLKYDDALAPSGKKCWYRVCAFRGTGRSQIRSRRSAAAAIRTVTRVFLVCGHGTDDHGRWDPGCTWAGVQEAKLMLPITRAAVKYMRSRGVYVYSDADVSNHLNMNKCIRWSNKKSISAYVSVHCDWMFARSGTLPLYKTPADRKLARALNRGVHAAVRIPGRGYGHRTDLAELNRTRPPSCIYETGSIRRDLETLSNKAQAYGRGLGKGFCTYLGIK